MAMKWGREAGAESADADRPRKPRGSQRPGHSRENLVMTALLLFVAATGALGFATWSVKVPGADPGSIAAAGNLMFIVAAGMLVSVGLWLFLDLRTPLLIVSGGSSVLMIVAGLVSPIFLVILPTALIGFWAGMSALGSHPRDRWATVIAAAVLSVTLGRYGILLFAPVALAAALVPMLDFGDADKAGEE